MQITLDIYKPRDYQVGLFRAMEKEKKKRAILCWPRRSGKDITAWNYLIRQALKRVGVYFAMYPTYSQGKKIIWDTVTNDSMRFIDYIPPILIKKTNSQEMKIYLINGSLIQVVGSENINSLVGTNPVGIIFSEYALQNGTQAYQFMRPILAANDGWCIFISTPRGKNFFWDLYKMAIEQPNWYVSKLTLDDTKHVPLEEIEQDRKEGRLSEDLILQEYYTSFEMGVEGAYYSKNIDRMRINGQITEVPWQADSRVWTAWDLGMRDQTTIIFFQCIGTTIRIIDCYSSSDVGLEHYAKVLNNKPYIYAGHIAPHDIKVRELGTGVSRIETARRLGINFTLSADLSVYDGIESVRNTLNKVYIDRLKCVDLINALESYRKEYDPRHKVYRNQPLHDHHSHYADAMRYLSVSQTKTSDGMSKEDIERARREAYGVPSRSPIFD